MERHDRFAMYCLANDRFDDLFAPYENYQGVESDYIHLMGGAPDRPFWAVLKPHSLRLGEVIQSNFLPVGVLVRSKIKFRHAARPRGNSLLTEMDPRRLEIVRNVRTPERPSRPGSAA